MKDQHFDQGFDDYWHYPVPRQPDNPEYMDGWDAGEAQEANLIDDGEYDYDDDVDYDEDF